MTNLNSSQWISSNISLTGFTRDNAAFMTCKELIENAVDATRDTVDPQIQLGIFLHEDCYRITCADNGRGFASESVDAIHTMFRSSQLGESSGTGKFGIGLKAMVLMSSLECGGKDVSIQSQAKDGDSFITFVIGCCDLGEVVIKSFEVDSSEVSDNLATRVTVFSPVLADCYSNICQYVRELTSGGFLNPHLLVHVNFDNVKAEEFKFAEIPKSVSHKDSGNFSTVISLVPSSESQIDIVRYVNGVPLITSNTSESNCSLLSAILGVVRKMAHSLGIVGIGPAFFTKSSVISSVSVGNKPNGSTWGSIVIRVNCVANSKEVHYTCLTKSSLSNLVVSLLVFTRFFRNALKRVQTRFPSQFQSVDQWEHSRALSEYIPIVSFNLKEMIQNSSETTQRIISEKIGDQLDISKCLSELLSAV